MLWNNDANSTLLSQEQDRDPSFPWDQACKSLTRDVYIEYNKLERLFCETQK